MRGHQFFPVAGEPLSNQQDISSVVSLQQPQKPKIYLIGTGGTIAGAGESATASAYKAGKVNIDELTNRIPALREIDARLKSRDLFHIDSSDITVENWLHLARTVNELLQKPGAQGVVITHGTDTLEETAYFLDLVVKSDKPVVLVGAMRASTSLSADGPINLYNAVCVANSAEAVGKGVLVVINDTIFDARDVTKTNTTRVCTFDAPNSGPLGSVHYGRVQFNKQVVRKHTIDTPFDVSELDTLPNVEIIYEHACQTGAVLKAVIASNPEGIVIAGTGDGSVPLRDKLLLQQAREKGIQIIRSSRTGSGYVTEDGLDRLDTTLGLIAGDNLSPQKARILLMLSLTKTKECSEIKGHFKKF